MAKRQQRSGSKKPAQVATVKIGAVVYVYDFGKSKAKKQIDKMCETRRTKASEIRNGRED